MINRPFILKDTREQTGWNYPEDLLFSGTKTKKLETGDYSLEGLEDFFTIERKANVVEIANNIVQDRFLDELERLAKIKHSFIICEFSCRDILNYPIGTGIPKQRQSALRVNGKFIIGKLIDFQLKFNVKIMFCDTALIAQQTTYSLLKHILYEYNSNNP